MKKSDTSYQEFRCLSIRQPWAWLACIGAKTIENRVWKTDYRGTIAIHASTSQSMIRSAARESDHGLIKLEDFPFGAIIGLVDLVSIDIYGGPHEEDGHACGPYCWRLENPRLFKQPIPMMGKLNLFKLNAELSESVRTAETYVLDWRNDARLTAIVDEFQPEPDASTSYAYTFEEIRDKASSDDVTQLLDRWTEIDPESIDAWKAWNVFYRRPLEREKLAKGVQRLSMLIESIFGDQDDGWREVYLESVDDDSDSNGYGSDDRDDDENRPIDDFWELVDLLSVQFWDYVDLEQNDTAIATAKRVAQLAPEDATTNFNLGYAYARLSNELPLAQAALERAWQLERADLERQAPADEETSEVIPIATMKPIILTELARTYRLLGDLELAEETIQIALRDHPEDGYVQLQAAFIAKERGDRDLALKYAKAALAIAPDLEEASKIVDEFGE